MQSLLIIYCHPYIKEKAIEHFIIFGIKILIDFLTVYKKILYCIFFALLPTTPGLQLNAQEVDSLAQKTENPINERQKQNSLFQKLSDRIDRFFSDQHIEEELQTSSIRLKPGVQWNQNGQLDYQLPTRINLVLPRLKNRWQVFFSSIPDDDNDQDPDRTDYTNDGAGLDEDEGTSSLLGLQFAPISKFEQHLKFITGIKIRINEFNPFALTRFRYSYPLGSWNLRVIQSAFYFADNGFGEKTQLDFDRPLGKETFFRSQSSATWSEQTQGVGLKQSFFLRHFLSQNNVLVFSWAMGGHTSPGTVVDGHTFTVGFRNKLWLDWLFWEISPQAFYRRKNGFRFEPALLSSFEIIF